MGELEDFAVLELIQPVDASNCKTLANWGDGNKEDQNFRSFGFSKQDGLWYDGKCPGMVKGWVKTDVNKSDVLPGCSGGAVFDDACQHLIGMMVAREKGEQIAYFIPVESFRKIVQPLMVETNTRRRKISTITNNNLAKKLIVELLNNNDLLPIKKAMLKVIEGDIGDTEVLDFDNTALALSWIDLANKNIIPKDIPYRTSSMPISSAMEIKVLLIDCSPIQRSSRFVMARLSSTSGNSSEKVFVQI